MTGNSRSHVYHTSSNRPKFMTLPIQTYIQFDSLVCLGRLKTVYQNSSCEPISIKRARKDWVWMAVSACSSGAPSVTGKLHEPRILNAWSSWQIINRQYLFSANVQSAVCMKNKSWCKLKLRKGNFWETTNFQSKASLQSQPLDCILHANSRLAAPQLAGTAFCYWSSRCYMKPHDPFILFLCTALNHNIHVKSTL